jgi:lambda repressor-like predicted transcriptional regulator
MHSKRRGQDWRAAELLKQLMAAHGWSPREVERRSLPAGDPNRQVSFSTVYAVLNRGHVPSWSTQFEIAAVFGLSPNMIWGRAPLPEHVRVEMGVVA